MLQNLSLSSLPGEGLRVETSALAFIVRPPSSPSVDTLDGTMRTQHGLKRFPFFFLEMSSWLKRCDQPYIATELYHFSGISIKQKQNRFGPSMPTFSFDTSSNVVENIFLFAFRDFSKSFREYFLQH